MWGILSSEGNCAILKLILVLFYYTYLHVTYDVVFQAAVTTVGVSYDWFTNFTLTVSQPTTHYTFTQDCVQVFTAYNF